MAREEEDDVGEVINLILRYKDTRILDMVKQDVLSIEEIMEYSDNTYDSYGREEVKARIISMNDLNNIWLVA